MGRLRTGVLHGNIRSRFLRHNLPYRPFDLEAPTWCLVSARMSCSTFFVAFIPARTLVSSAMRLPSQDFDATVAMLAVIAYPGLWLLLLSILCLLIGLLQLVKFYIIHISTLPLIDNFVKFVGRDIRN